MKSDRIHVKGMKIVKCKKLLLTEELYFGYSSSSEEKKTLSARYGVTASSLRHVTAVHKHPNVAAACRPTTC